MNLDENPTHRPITQSLSSQYNSSLFSTRRILILCAWAAIVFFAMALRLHDIEERPMHADEATGARILANRLDGKDYEFNPQHFHGPLLSLLSKPIAALRAEENWAELSTFTLRLGPAIAGGLLVLTPLLWNRRFGMRASLASATLLASSPLLVYYNRMYIHESLLALFAMLGVAAFYSLVERPSRFRAVSAGLCLGLMFATKETFIISAMSWSAAFALIIVLRKCGKSCESNIEPTRFYLCPILLATIIAALTSSYYYSDGFQHTQGIVDAIRTYFIYETTAGHEKPLAYYIHLLIWPKNELGIWWTEALILILATTGCVSALRNKTPKFASKLFLVVTILGHFAIYSLIGYKTPWLMLVPWSHACLLAGCAFTPKMLRTKRITTALASLLILGVAYQTKQSLHATGRFANDLRNPYAYVPTSKDPAAIEKWLATLAAENEITPIAVIGSEYWPLPWYLRSFDTIGYWPTPTDEIISYPIVFSMPEQNLASRKILSETHTELPRGLRTNVPILLYVRNDIWDHWMQQTDQ